MKVYESEILSGDAGSVNNQLKRLLKKVETIVSMTQSTSSGASQTLFLTIIYTPRPDLPTELEPLTDADYMPLDR